MLKIEKEISELIESLNNFEELSSKNRKFTKKILNSRVIELIGPIQTNEQRKKFKSNGTSKKRTNFDLDN